MKLFKKKKDTDVFTAEMLREAARELRKHCLWSLEPFPNCIRLGDLYVSQRYLLNGYAVLEEE